MAILKKNTRLPALLALLLILTGFSFAGAQEEELILDNPEAYREKHRPAVTFPHDLHVGELECLVCHHDYEDGVNILVEEKLEEENPDLLCAACHNAGSNIDLKSTGSDTDLKNAGSDIDLKAAYHGQCMGCHRLLRIAGFATGPELCGECHIK